MDKTIGFANVHITMEDSSVSQIMFLHKHFLFVDMGGGNVSFIPLSQEDEEDLMKHNMNFSKEVTDLDIMETLDLMLDGRTAENELKKLLN